MSGSALNNPTKQVLRGPHIPPGTSFTTDPFDSPYIMRKQKEANPFGMTSFHFGGAEPRLNSVDISGDFLTKLPKTEVQIPNPAFRVFIIGRKVLNYCGNFGSEE